MPAVLSLYALEGQVPGVSNEKNNSVSKGNFFILCYLKARKLLKDSLRSVFCWGEKKILLQVLERFWKVEGSEM